MQNRPVEILLVEPDVELAAMMGDCLRDGVSANVTVVSDAAGALREELTTRHDLLLVSTDLTDATWSDLIREVRVTNRCPILLLAADPSTDDVLSALRSGVTDVLVKPFDLAQACTRIDQVCRRFRARRRAQTRNRRLRRLTAKIIRERRDLRQRIDLICRDFVHAYRRLAQRVTDTELLSK